MNDVTDEMIELAAREMSVRHLGDDTRWRSYVEDMRAALAAALARKEERTCATCHAVLADGPQPAATYEATLARKPVGEEELA